jgi:anti-sigma B factor antagonist
MAFTQQVRADAGGLVVTVAGELDYTSSGSFEQAVHGLIDSRHHRTVVLDLAELRFVDSTAVSVLVRLWRLARRENCSLRVVNATGMVRQVLDVTGAATLLGIAAPAPDTATK